MELTALEALASLDEATADRLRSAGITSVEQFAHSFTHRNDETVQLLAMDEPAAWALFERAADLLGRNVVLTIANSPAWNSEMIAAARQPSEAKDAAPADHPAPISEKVDVADGFLVTIHAQVPTSEDPTHWNDAQVIAHFKKGDVSAVDLRGAHLLNTPVRMYLVHTDRRLWAFEIAVPERWMVEQLRRNSGWAWSRYNVKSIEPRPAGLSL